MDKKVSSSTQNQALSAVLFLYRYVFGLDIGDLGDVVRARRPLHIPVVMTRAECQAVLGNMRGETLLIASLLYGSGLRLLVRRRHHIRSRAVGGTEPCRMWR